MGHLGPRCPGQAPIFRCTQDPARTYRHAE